MHAIAKSALLLRASILFLVSVAVSAIGCRERNAAQLVRDESPIVEATPEITIYPVVITELPPEVLKGAAASLAVAKANDEACAFIEMDPSLAPQREDGLGCPRPLPGDAEGAR
jgi:hypothetical protein